MSTAAMSQRVRTMRLYRHSLKHTLSWVFSRDVWFQKAALIRGEFEANKHITEPVLVDSLLAKGEARLAELTHPNPYIVPYYYGGSLYARNPPVPKEIKVHMDWARED